MNTGIESFIDHLQRGDVEAFNTCRPTPHQDEEPPDLSGIIIPRGTNLSGVNLKRMNLCKARFINVDLTNASLKDTLLEGALFSECILRKTDFSRAVLDYATFRKTETAEAYFWGTSFTRTDLRDISDPKEIRRIRKEGEHADRAFFSEEIVGIPRAPYLRFV